MLARGISSASESTLHSPDLEPISPHGMSTRRPSNGVLRRVLEQRWLQIIYCAVLLCICGSWTATVLLLSLNLAAASWQWKLLMYVPGLTLSLMALICDIVFSFKLSSHMRVQTLRGGVKHVRERVLRALLLVNFAAALTDILVVLIVQLGQLHDVWHVPAEPVSHMPAATATQIVLGVFLLVFMTFPATVFVLQKQERTVDGTVQPLFYLRCLCWPWWAARMAVCVLPFLFLSFYHVIRFLQMRSALQEAGCQLSFGARAAAFIAIALPQAYGLVALVCVVCVPPRRRIVAIAFVLMVIATASMCAIGISPSWGAGLAPCQAIERSHNREVRQTFQVLTIVFLVLSLVLKTESFFHKPGMDKISYS